MALANHDGTATPPPPSPSHMRGEIKEGGVAVRRKLVDNPRANSDLSFKC